MFRLEAPLARPDSEETRKKMRAEVLVTVRNFTLYVLALRVGKCAMSTAAELGPSRASTNS
uniref:mitochondrial import receptor subunit TOM5 homolog n=1 Tax=Myxine glutinosa TaxID=7769 RepID=UPI00358E3F58